MSIIETIVDVPADHQRNVFGQFDVFVKKIERTLRVTMIARDGELKIIGPQGAVNKAKSVFNNLIELSKRGNLIMEQNVDMHFRWLSQIKKMRFWKLTKILYVERSMGSQ